MSNDRTAMTTEQKPKSAALEIKKWLDTPSMQSALAAALTGYMDVRTFAAQCYIHRGVTAHQHLRGSRDRCKWRAQIVGHRA